jgi:hypothetical protein
MNTLAYLASSSALKEKSFITLAPASPEAAELVQERVDVLADGGHPAGVFATSTLEPEGAFAGRLHHPNAARSNQQVSQGSMIGANTLNLNVAL